MVWLLFSCNLEKNNESEFSFGDGGQACYNSADCPKNSVCLDEICQRRGCITSADCKIGRYCTEQYKCRAGCELDSDCFPGQECQDNVCLEYSCRSTDLDCRVGEFCGEDGCQSDPFPHCEPCEVEDFYQGVDNGLCVFLEIDYEQWCEWNPQTQQGSSCSDGLTCFPRSFLDPNAGGGVCAESLALKFCESDPDCPRGFTCYQNIFYSQDPENQVNACIGECDYYVEQGYLP
ncbi:MAG: hypothetical protein CMK59_07450 [Proteobacteria bacterium]|nr:hypothetical protein [Pseudomonadota bacterium]